MTTPQVTPARLLAAAIEPIAGQAQFSPECHANYQALGFDPSPGFIGATAVPDRSAYFTARGSVLGQVPGTVVAAAFAVFNPAVVVPLVDAGWQRTDAATIWAARQSGAVAQLRRILAPDTSGGASAAGASEVAGAREIADRLLEASEVLPLAGRALFAGQRSLDVPEEPLARLWRATDRLREYRGDSHILAWAGEGLDPVEVGLLGDLYWGLPARAHTAGRGWTDDDLAAGEGQLRQRGLLDGDALTVVGFEIRDRIETRTDELVEPVIRSLGDHFEDTVARLRPWAAAITACGGYLSPAVRFTFPLDAPST